MIKWCRLSMETGYENVGITYGYESKNTQTQYRITKTGKKNMAVLTVDDVTDWKAQPIPSLKALAEQMEKQKNSAVVP